VRGGGNKGGQIREKSKVVNEKIQVQNSGGGGVNGGGEGGKAGIPQQTEGMNKEVKVGKPFVRVWEKRKKEGEEINCREFGKTLPTQTEWKRIQGGRERDTERRKTGSRS